mmetsp:Transcript_540/g.1473  ORF Transcript_540/g.1473 Transcript_540/m.1473 type:complete len:219 (-) Transcript_540:1185-1841(-)
MTFFHSVCFFFQSSSVFCHSPHASLNHFPGWRSSTRCVALRFSTHSRKYSEAAAAACHSKRTSSKPSSCAGKLNLVKALASSTARTSGKGLLRKTSFFSSSVSSTFTSSSSTSTFSSSSFFSSPSPPSSFPAALAAAALTCLRLASRSFLRSASAFFRLASASAFARFSWSKDARTPSLKPSAGSPTSTLAVFLKPANFSTMALRLSAIRLLRMSGTT